MQLTLALASLTLPIFGRREAEEEASFDLLQLNKMSVAVLLDPYSMGRVR